MADCIISCTVVLVSVDRLLVLLLLGVEGVMVAATVAAAQYDMAAILILLRLTGVVIMSVIV